ncbi:NADAR family protein [Calothrix sp. 336/3]|uniref:NADAR family protein n=1 Tax=Calothrix sp. 336/3 TaxID=1337936 RepID=UPI0004E34804|nr:NADAR family protein [Calothrix sp. 336/3]AKG20473.1 Swarming motility protein ybiA [Calothrix sp. 336/3]
MPIYFYTTIEEYGAFSNFSRHGVELDGLWWMTVEHYFQGQKFLDLDYQEKIRNAHTPKQAAELGRSRKVPLRSDWEIVKDGIMLLAVRKKFSTHGAIRELLLSTGDEEIIENAPGDYYWGCGKDGTGLNKLGKILQQVRQELRQKSE